MKLCESCAIEHDGKFASGRFCSRECSRSFSTKAKRKDINEKVSKALRKTEKIKLDSILCEGCREPFIPKNKKIRFCSRTCAVKATTKGWKNHKTINWSEINKLSYSNGSNYVSGGTVKWITYKNIKVQGTYELRTCYILDMLKDNKLIFDWTYSTDRIKYKHNNKIHTYIIDFKVFTSFDSFYYLEIKGLIRDVDYSKWSTVRKLGYKIKIWKLSTIKKLENKFWPCRLVVA